MDPSRWPEVQQQQPPANPNPSADPYAYAHCYNAHQSSFPHYPLYSSHQSQILGTPSLLLPEIPSTAFLVSNPDAALRPPGTGTVHSYAALNSYLPPPPPPPHAAAQVGGATYYQDPGIAHNWPAKDAVLQYGADPLANAAAGESPNKKTIVPQCPTTMSLKNNCINHPLANDRSPRREIVQSLQCKVCKIDCNSKHVFDQHILGKKHKRSLLKQKLLSKNSIAPGIAPIPKIPRRTKKKSLSGEVGWTIDQRMTMEPSVLAATDDLETKRQNLVEHGAEVDSVVVCGICNVVCNSFIMFSSHLAGKRHAAQVKSRELTQNLVLPFFQLALNSSIPT